MSSLMFTGLLLGVAFGASVVLLVAAWRGWHPGWRRTRRVQARADRLFGAAARKRTVAAVGVGLVVALVTRWPVAAAVAAALVYLWPMMFGASRATAGHLAQLEALAAWTETLRDSIAGSVGLEEAIRHSVHVAPEPLVGQLQRLEGRLRAQFPLPQALAAFAEEIDDSAADLVVAALILNSRLRGPGLIATLTELATSAREEIDMRRRMEVQSKSLRRTALIIVGVLVMFASAMVLFSRDYVAPYSTALGQLVLVVVCGIFAAGLMWIRSAAVVRPPERFLVDSGRVEQALRAGERRPA